MRHFLFIFVLSFLFCAIGGAVGPKDTDPEKNFDALWESFNKRYAFFELRGVDWQSQYEKYRPKVTTETTDEELFAIFCAMLQPLKDAHVNLKAKGLKNGTFNPEQTPRFLEEFDSNKKLRQFQKLVQQTLLSEGFDTPEQANDILLYSHNGDYGYLLIKEFDGVSTTDLQAGLNKAISAMDGIEGLIIDIRLNPGGTDKCVYQISERFTDKRRIGHHRKTKTGPGPNEFSELKTRYLEPPEIGSRHPVFTGPITLLTHGASYSAADVFAMLMADLPHVTIIGEPTHGIFSNMLERKLPNGWKYTLSHQVYYAADKTCYEGRGIPVDIEMQNNWTDVELGTDPLIIKSLEVLANQPEPLLQSTTSSN
mgnify:CR=1 FL=1